MEIWFFSLQHPKKTGNLIKVLTAPQRKKIPVTQKNNYGRNEQAGSTVCMFTLHVRQLKQREVKRCIQGPSGIQDWADQNACLQPPDSNPLVHKAHSKKQNKTKNYNSDSFSHGQSILGQALMLLLLLRLRTWTLRALFLVKRGLPKELNHL